MIEKKSRCLINSINVSLLSTKRRRFNLSQFFCRKVYNIDEIYGIFSEECGFQFVRESSVPFEEWEKVLDNKCPFPYYELVHKRQFQLFSMDSGTYLTEPYVGDVPWHKGEIVNLNGYNTIPIEAKSFIPKNFIIQNKIDEADLKRFSNFISRILDTNPTLLKGYFPTDVEPQKVI